MGINFSLLFCFCALLCNVPEVQASRRFVLSGGPCIGKSTVLRELGKRGYQTVPEVFTLLFEQAAHNNALDTFFEDPDKLPFYLLDEQLRLESCLSATLPAFLDRSAVDIIAYGDYFNSPMPDTLRNAADRHYDLVFFLEPLPEHLYVTTAVCKESPQEALKLHDVLKNAYRARGYTGHQMIDVPFGTPEQRAQYILDTITHIYFYVDMFDCFANNSMLYPFQALWEPVKLTTL